jgi:predicted enzyme related to lactoylglutathione lyase
MSMPPSPSTPARPAADARRHAAGAGGWNRFVLEVDDLDATLAAGAQLRSDIVSGPGGRQLVVDDPSGNPVELFEPQRA